MSEEDFLRSPITITQDAVIRNLEIIGEACHNVLRHHAAFAADHGNIPWRSPYEMRNALTHGYFSVDLVSTWTTVLDDLPDFESRIQTLLLTLR
jgi:uncharacterized protein with HEPN domain